MFKVIDPNTHNMRILDEKGNIRVVEYMYNFNVDPQSAMSAYYAGKMNVRKRQVIATLSDGNGIIVNPGAMQWVAGNVKISSNIRSLGNIIRNATTAKLTQEKIVRPLYTGSGIVALEPTYRYLILEDLKDWDGGMVLENNMFIACDANAKLGVTARNTISSALLGNEGFFNTYLAGDGVVVLGSKFPRQELICIELHADTLRIDGSLAIAWSKSLKFTVEEATSTLAGSALSGEGLLNVYRGTGRVLMSPF